MEAKLEKYEALFRESDWRWIGLSPSVISEDITVSDSPLSTWHWWGGRAPF